MGYVPPPPPPVIAPHPVVIPVGDSSPMSVAEAWAAFGIVTAAVAAVAVIVVWVFRA